MHQLSGTAVVIFNKLNSLDRRTAELMISDSSLSTDTKLRYLGLLPLKEKLMFNKAVVVFKACKNLAPPYLKQLFICSNIRATSRYITLPKPRIDLFKTSFSFSGASLWNTIPNQIKSCNSLTSEKKGKNEKKNREKKLNKNSGRGVVQAGIETLRTRTRKL